MDFIGILYISDVHKVDKWVSRAVVEIRELFEWERIDTF